MTKSANDLGHADLAAPFWSGYRARLADIREQGIPPARLLCNWLPQGLVSGGGSPIRFVPAQDIPGVDYEKHIFETGEVSTRDESPHDLFNAMVWARFPRLKVAINTCHYRELPGGGDKGRSRFRDALTLLDESGAIVCSPHRDLLESLARRQWQEAFNEKAAMWADSQVLVCGHALLEKFPRPYKAITAKVLFVYDEAQSCEAAIDEYLARKLLAGELFDDPSGLSPLPLMGIPGWWPTGDQDQAFYADQKVFRAPLNCTGQNRVWLIQDIS